MQTGNISYTLLVILGAESFNHWEKIKGIQLNYLKRSLVALCLMSCAGLLYAKDVAPIGYVMKASGAATVVSDGKSVSAVVGTPVNEGSTLRVGPGGAMGVTLKDNTVMSLGPNSELVIEEYLYAPAKNDLKLTTRMVHGTLNFISGVIAKLRPEAVQINTPTGTIGVRGTHFVVKVDE